MREHRYTIEMPHSPARLWALFQDYDNWTDVRADGPRGRGRVTRATQDGNGLLRRVIYKMPLGRSGSALELVTDVEPERGYTFTMLSHEPGNDQTGKVRLEPAGPNRTRFSLRGALPPHEGARGSGSRDRSTGSSTRRTRRSMQRASAWLTEHPEYRPDLVEP